MSNFRGVHIRKLEDNWAPGSALNPIIIDDEDSQRATLKINVDLIHGLKKQIEAAVRTVRQQFHAPQEKLFVEQKFKHPMIEFEAQGIGYEKDRNNCYP